MVFNSYIFIFLFLPIVLTGFYLLKQLHNPLLLKGWLIGMTLWFYGYCNPKCIVLILVSILGNYFFFRVLCKRKKKGILAAGILCNLLSLFFFKYLNFFLENCNQIFHTDFALLHILLPLGISFYSFQQIAFLTDAYHGEVEDCSLIDYCSFVLFFPQLVSGPIATHADLMPQIKDVGKRNFDTKLFCQGIFLFVAGLFKKVLIADVYATAVNWGFDNVKLLDSTNAILVMLFFTIQLYFDFSGYSDMARGLANMLGYKLPINFNSPLKAVNLIDFWKRWHMTLTRFLTHYVYFPLGGNRKGKLRTYINLLLVFLVSGIWHGVAWTFIIWGLIHGVCYALTKLCMPVLKKIPTFLTGAATYLVVNVAFIFFRSESLSQALDLLKGICSFQFGAVQSKVSSGFELPELWYALKVTKLAGLPFSHLYCLVIYLLATLGILFFAKNTNELAEKFRPRLFTAFIMGIMFVWCVLSFSGVNSFLYFNF